MHEIVDAYEHVADGDSPREVFTDGGLIRALGTFALAAGKCLASDLPDLPDISLPDISLPDISLPGALAAQRGRPSRGAMNTMSASPSSAPSHFAVPHT